MGWICNFQNASRTHVLWILNIPSISHFRGKPLKTFLMKHSSNAYEFLYTLLDITFMHILNRFVEKHILLLFYTIFKCYVTFPSTRTKAQPYEELIIITISWRDDHQTQSFSLVPAVIRLNKTDAIPKDHFWWKWCNTARPLWMYNSDSK